MLGINKAEGHTALSISATSLPTLIRSTRPVVGFFLSRSNASFLGSSRLFRWWNTLIVDNTLDLGNQHGTDGRSINLDLLALITKRFSFSR